MLRQTALPDKDNKSSIINVVQACLQRKVQLYLLVFHKGSYAGDLPNEFFVLCCYKKIKELEDLQLRHKEPNLALSVK